MAPLDTVLARCRHASQTLQSRTRPTKAAVTISDSHSLPSQTRSLPSRSQDSHELQINTLHRNATGPDHRTPSRHPRAHRVCTRCRHVSHTLQLPTLYISYTNAAVTITKLAHAAVYVHCTHPAFTSTCIPDTTVSCAAVTHWCRVHCTRTPAAISITALAHAAVRSCNRQVRTLHAVANTPYRRLHPVPCQAWIRDHNRLVHQSRKRRCREHRIPTFCCPELPRYRM